MLEYAALSSSDPADLARQMTERSAQGWEILQIVSTGATVTAFVRRAAIAATISNTATASVAPVASTPSTATPTYASTSASLPTTATTQPVTTATTSVASSVGDAVAPAAWYPDPSKRYELRYWNGTAWTEHVSRAGQQFTDPPVA
jgi:hypothetical protein